MAGQRKPLSEAQMAQRRAANAKGLTASILGTQQRYARLVKSAPKCGRPTRTGTPCRLPLVNGKCLTHDGMTKAERAAHCRAISPLGNYAALRGEQHPGWKGDQAKPHNGRHRAQRLYPLKPCEVCGLKPEDGEIHRHHKDRNTLNNAPDNIQMLCLKHHTEAHQGQFAWFEFDD